MSGTRLGYLPSLLLFNIILDGLPYWIKHEKLEEWIFKR